MVDKKQLHTVKLQPQTAELFRRCAALYAPPPPLTISQWADTYRMISAESSASPGLWDTRNAPYQREIMDAMGDPHIRKVVLMTAAQIGKALAVDTPIATPDGWKTMLDIRTGDTVFDESGHPCRVTGVTAVMLGHKCYRVVFSDGAELIADADHQWTVDRAEGNGKSGRYTRRVLTTEELSKDYILDSGVHRTRYAIPVAGALECEERILPIQPYSFGVWLGDGSSRSGKFYGSRDDFETVSYVRADGYTVSVAYVDDGRNFEAKITNPWPENICVHGHNMDVLGRTKKGYCLVCSRQAALKHKYKDATRVDRRVKPDSFYERLRKMDEINNKHIPELYLRASVEQRIALLQGIMDTDGSITENGRCEISQKSKRMADGISELLNSLGIKHTVKTKEASCVYKGERRGSVVYRISFMAYSDIPVFRMRRKAARMKSRTDRGNRGGVLRTSETCKRRIVSIEEVDSVPVKCITVDSPNHLYLAGRAMIPTHNTAMLLNVLGYYMHYYPAPILVIQPTLDMAQAFSKDFLAPTIRDTPVLSALVDVKSRYSGNTILKKNFPGGHVTIIGANSTAGLRMRPIKVVLADEIDAYPKSAGTEGDPLMLAQKRQTTFWDKKTIMVSTPTIKGQSRIEAEYEESTQEEWTVPCPCCGHYQPLMWRGIKFDPDDLSKPVMYECERCGTVSGEYEWKAMGQNGRYHVRNPGAEARGFFLNTLSSNFCSWREVVEKFLFANQQRKQGDFEKLKAWVNTELGETWEEPGTSIDGGLLFNRREIYDAEVPRGVKILTAGVDVQKDRFEVEVVGWGEGSESWGIRYQRIFGDVLRQQVWEDLDRFLLQPFTRKNGEQVYISCVCMDSGYQTNAVCSFAKDRMFRRVFAIKGKNQVDAPYIPRETTSNREGAPLFALGVSAGKTLMFQRLNVAEPGPNYCHFPRNPEAGYDLDYFYGLTSEQQVTHFRRGILVSEWVKRQGNEYKRNEPLDLRNYASAAFEILGRYALKQPKTANGAVRKPAAGRRQISRGL